MRGMNDQQRLSKSVRSERSALIAFGVVIVLLFKVNLASWVLSLSLAKDMSIQCGYDCVQKKLQANDVSSSVRNQRRIDC